MKVRPTPLARLAPALLAAGWPCSLLLSSRAATAQPSASPPAPAAPPAAAPPAPPPSAPSAARALAALRPLRPRRAHRAAAESGAFVSIHDRHVFEVLVPRKGRKADERAAAASQALQQLLEEKGEPDVRVQGEGDALVVYAGKTPIIQLGPDDAAAAGDASLGVHAQGVADKVRGALRAERQRSAIATTVFAFSLLVFSGLIAFLLVRKVGELFEKLRAWIDDNPGKLPALRVRGIEVVQPAAVKGGIGVALSGAILVARIGIFYAWVLIALSLFDATRGYSERLTGFVLTPVSALMGRVALGLPLLVIALVTSLAVGVALRFVRLFFGSVARGETTVGWMPRDLAEPTSLLVRAGIVVVTLVVAAPLITGGDEGTLSRAGVVALVSIGLAATPMLACAAVGVAVVFGRRLRVGDFAVVGGREGQVRALTMLEVLLEDEDGCRVHVPHLLGLWHATRVVGASPRVAVEVSVDAAADLPRVIEILRKAAGGSGARAKVSVIALDHGGARVRVAAEGRGGEGRNALYCAIAAALSREGVGLGRRRGERARVSAIWLLMGLLVLSYVGSFLVGRSAARGGLPAGTEYVILGFVLGPSALGLVERSMLVTFEPVVYAAIGWLAFVLGLQYGVNRGRRVRPLRIAASWAAFLFTGAAIAAAVYGVLLLVGPFDARDRLLVAGGVGASTAETTRYAVRWVVDKRPRPGPPDGPRGRPRRERRPRALHGRGRALRAAPRRRPHALAAAGGDVDRPDARPRRAARRDGRGAARPHLPRRGGVGRGAGHVHAHHRHRLAPRPRRRRRDVRDGHVHLRALPPPERHRGHDRAHRAARHAPGAPARGRQRRRRAPRRGGPLAPLGPRRRRRRAPRRQGPGRPRGARRRASRAARRPPPRPRPRLRRRALHDARPRVRAPLPGRDRRHRAGRGGRRHGGRRARRPRSLRACLRRAGEVPEEAPTLARGGSRRRGGAGLVSAAAAAAPKGVRVRLGQAAVLAVLFALVLGATRLMPHGSGRGALVAALGFLLVAGTLLSELVEVVRLPHLTGYLIAGVVAGPYVGELIDAPTVQGLTSINALALALIALEGGAELKLATLREVWKSLAWATLFQSVPVLLLMAGVFIAARPLVPFLRPLSPGALVGVGLLWGAIAITRSPSATLGILSQTRATGPVARSTLTFVMTSDIVVVVLVAVAMMVARPLIEPAASFSLHALGTLGYELLGSVALGTTLGLVLAAYLRLVDRQISLVLVALGFGATEVLGYLRFDALLTFMVAGFVVQNLSRQGEKLTHATGEMGTVVYVVFFATAGAQLDVPLLRELWPVALLLAAVRGALTFVAARIGSRVADDAPEIRRWGWAGLIAQAGLALPLISAIAHAFPAFGGGFAALAIATVAMNAMIGPVLFKLALDRAKESSTAPRRSLSTLSGGAGAAREG